MSGWFFVCSVQSIIVVVCSVIDAPGCGCICNGFAIVAAAAWAVFCHQLRAEIANSGCKSSGSCASGGGAGGASGAAGRIGMVHGARSFGSFLFAVGLGLDA